MKLGKYSMGIGDRFGHQGQAQLQALIRAKEQGVEITPVWNKSHREHTIIGTGPADTRLEADAAVKALGWEGDYFVDADHINLNNVNGFIEASDFFTLDVADYIGQQASADDLKAFVETNRKYIGAMNIPGIDESFEITEGLIGEIAGRYLLAIQEAGKIYSHIESVKGKDSFITEVSTDEAEVAQTPIELFFILGAIAQEGIPAQTIAPKFTGRFNKGVDYVGDVEQFSREFEQDVAVIAHAVKEFSLPDNLKLSVHSGSDKFSLYAPIRETLLKFDAGVHLKTAGTTWLEELIGLAEAGGDGLELAKEVYVAALKKYDELCAPYATVIDIDRSDLPTAEAVDIWNEETFALALRHNQHCEMYNLNFRQLLHVGYKIAAQMGPRYLNALKDHEEVIGRNVSENIYKRHLKPIFIG